MVKRRPKTSLTFSVDGRAPRVRPGVFPERILVMSKKITIKAGSRNNNEPRLVGTIVEEMLQGWNRNTHLSVDLKTQLRSDHYMKPGKSYQGVLRRDIECDEFLYGEHFTFVETEAPATGKRNPHVFRGKHITITRRDDGTYRPKLPPRECGCRFQRRALCRRRGQRTALGS